MRIALCQFTSTANVEDNLATICAQIKQAAAQGAELAVFPEAAMRAFGTGRMDITAQPLDGPFAQTIIATACAENIVVMLGMFRPADVKGDKNRVSNTMLIAGPGYEQGAVYDKIHCYDAFGSRESDTVRPGERHQVVEVAGVNVGVAICFDIRFPEHFIQLAKSNAQLIVISASWASGPGKTAQWELLARARALDSTCYVVAVDQALPADRDPEVFERASTGIGHSLVVDPTGVVLHTLGRGEELRIVDLPTIGETIDAVRRDIPVISMR